MAIQAAVLIPMLIAAASKATHTAVAIPTQQKKREKSRKPVGDVLLDQQEPTAAMFSQSQQLKDAKKQKLRERMGEPAMGVPAEEANDALV